MSWWGLLLGGTFGFLLGGPIGALLGAAAGRLVGGALGNIEIADASGEGVERVQLAFFAAVFWVMGHVAKADGRVSPEEICGRALRSTLHRGIPAIAPPPLAWKYVSGDGGNAGTSLRVSGPGSSPG